jgi:hypothetical protein
MSSKLSRQSAPRWRWDYQLYETAAVSPQKYFSFSVSVINFCSRLKNPQGLVRLEGLGKLRNFIDLLGFETATFRLVAQCLKQLCYRVHFLYLNWKYPKNYIKLDIQIGLDILILTHVVICLNKLNILDRMLSRKMIRFKWLESVHTNFRYLTSKLEYSD